MQNKKLQKALQRKLENLMFFARVFSWKGRENQ